MATAQRPKSCGNFFPPASPSGNCPTPLCSLKRFRGRAWENSRKLNCANNSLIGSGNKCVQSLFRRERLPRIHVVLNGEHGAACVDVEDGGGDLCGFVAEQIDCSVGGVFDGLHSAEWQTLAGFF